MLPRDRRIHRSGEIKLVVKTGLRVSGRLMVLYCLTSPTPGESSGPARAGLIVGRAVGGSVTRHRVSRILRHQLAPRLVDRPGWRVVVRGLPRIAAADSDEVGDALERAFARADRQAGIVGTLVGHRVGSSVGESV